MTMVIETNLYRPSMWFFFIIKMITPWSSTMIIRNGRMVNNYALE